MVVAFYKVTLMFANGLNDVEVYFKERIIHIVAGKILNVCRTLWCTR